MALARFARRGNVIINLDTGNEDHFSSINKAKRQSRDSQPRLGDGTLRVIRRKQKQRRDTFVGATLDTSTALGLRHNRRRS